MKVNLINLPLTDYRKAWDLQRKIHSLRVKDSISDTLILLEHPHVITLGKSGKLENILIPEEELRKRGIEIYRVERGGDVTYHGPGQLVGYFIFSLDGGLGSLAKFVGKIEKTLIEVLKYFGIKGERREKYRGVWVDGKKIAAIGLAVKERVTFHGFALNVNTDLDFFKLIVPCGLKFGVTSMEIEKGIRISMEAVRNGLKRAVESIFECKLIERDELIWEKIL